LGSTVVLFLSQCPDPQSVSAQQNLAHCVCPWAPKHVEPGEHSVVAALHVEQIAPVLGGGDEKHAKLTVEVSTSHLDPGGHPAFVIGLQLAATGRTQAPFEGAVAGASHASPFRLPLLLDAWLVLVPLAWELLG
jgi:hypothetical protein